MSSDVSPDQKRYLEDFASGLAAARAPRGKLPLAIAACEATAPDTIHIKAQDRVLAAGGTLSDPQKFSRELNPFDGYERLKLQAGNNAGEETFLGFSRRHDVAAHEAIFDAEAKRMTQRLAKDVEVTLVDVVAQHGASTPEKAAVFFSELKKKGRYQQDVY